jgi:hypothetical protein
VLSPVKLWVLAMLAPKRGLRVAAVPPHAANLTGPARDAGGMAGRDEGTGALIEPRNMDQAVYQLAEWAIHPIQLLARSGVRLKTPSHTEILTVPVANSPHHTDIRGQHSTFDDGCVLSALCRLRCG